jgi:hypothetical protein
MLTSNDRLPYDLENHIALVTGANHGIARRCEAGLANVIHMRWGR